LSVYFKNESYDIGNFYIGNGTFAGKKCHCKNCSVYDNSIGVNDIIITKKRISIDRDKKLKQLLN
jgi:hypothetical protein